MRSFWTTPADPHYPTSIHPALNSFADECYATLARLVAYVGALVLLAMAGLHLWDELPDTVTPEPAAKAGWNLASRSHPAFAVSSLDFHVKTETYEIFRHPEGGRKDVLHWTAQDEKPVAELEIYRPGGEFNRSDAAGTEIATRMDPHLQGDLQRNPQGLRGLEAAGQLEAAGIIDSKFGPVTLLRLVGDADGAKEGNKEGNKSCLGFIKRLGDSTLQLSGWTCQGEGSPARRAAIGCMLNRLTLLTAGNEPKLAELFARAELKRGSCAAAATSVTPVDWVTGTENPRLRGPL
jgi:hypothetical protein